jgi:hypothetical protein
MYLSPTLTRLAFGVAAAALASLAGSGTPANGQPRTPSVRFALDRAAVRFTAPETGGLTRPQVFTERELACLARIEALIEERAVPADYADRYRRAVTQRAIGEELLAALQLARGSEPRNLPGLAGQLRRDIEQRVGGADTLNLALRTEGVASAELDHWLRQRVRAASYADANIAPLSSIADDELFGLYQGSDHPFKGRAFTDARSDFTRFVASERLRRIATEYLQSARSRVVVTYL